MRTYSGRMRAQREKDIRGAAAVEVFVAEGFRQRGVGASLCTAVVQAVRRTGLAPVATCVAPAVDGEAQWKGVLEEAGMVSMSRLLEVTLSS